jgi:peptidoglycan/LPS O-acetylase OafA/YrhL
MVLLVFGAAVPPFLAITLPISGAYLLLAVALCTPEIGRAFFKRFDLSYGTYLYGWPVGQLVLLGLGGHTSPWLMLTLTLPLTLLVAFGSWTLVERRFLLMKPRRIARRAQPGTV